MISNKDLHRIIEDTWSAVRKTRAAKAAEYAVDNDALINFRRCADQSGSNMEHILMIFAMKHWNSIVDYIRDLDAGKTRERTESIDNRINDLIVYLVLFKGMIEERAACQVTETSANSSAVTSLTSTGSASRQVPRLAE